MVIAGLKSSAYARCTITVGFPFRKGILPEQLSPQPKFFTNDVRLPKSVVFHPAKRCRPSHDYVVALLHRLDGFCHGCFGGRHPLDPIRFVHG